MIKRSEPNVDISEMLGKTFVSIEGMCKNSESVLFQCDDGYRYKMYHDQECCEHVYLEDVAGNVEDLLYSPITLAEVVTNKDSGDKVDDCDESWMWTYYKLATVKGYVTLRWYGASNGYYSEEVQIDLEFDNE